MKVCPAVVLLFLLSHFSFRVNANEPEWMAHLTRLSPGNFEILDSCELVYHLSWSDILKAGETRIRFSSRGKDGQTPGEIYARSDVRSSGLARALWPYDATTESWVDRKTLLPIRVLQEEEDRNERNIYRTNFNLSNVVNVWTSTEKREGSSPVARNRTYPQTVPPMHDMMSAMLFLRSLSFGGMQDKPISVVCYPFRDPYLINITPVGREKRKMLGREVPTLKFEVTLAKIESDLSLKVYDEKMKSAYFWISDDSRRLPLELKANIFIGSIEVTLKQYRELGTASPAAATQASSTTGVRDRQPLFPRKRSRPTGGVH